MAELDQRAPVIVAGGQITHRQRDVDVSPLELMLAAVDAATGDGPTCTLLAAVQSIGVVDCLSWPVADPAALLSSQLGLDRRETLRTLTGGTGPIDLLGHQCMRIQAGELDVALIAGAEAINPFMRASREGRSTGWPQQPAVVRPGHVLGSDRTASHPAEQAAGLLAPLYYYPWFEHALRASLGRTQQQHSQWLGELWQRFAAVAANNPHAWTQQSQSARQIAAPTAGNRMAAHPYTKLLSANIQVDQGAAVLLCSKAAAAKAGIPRERWVFVHATAAAHDRWFACERMQLHRSPAIAACARSSLTHARVTIDEIALLDLYSCFPSAVQIAAIELGIDLELDRRAPTVTGGLTFAGGPGSNYVTHSLAAMAERLRQAPGSMGLLTAVGWYMTKHANALLGTASPRHRFQHFTPQQQIDALPGRPLAEPSGTAATVESYTVIFNRDEVPARALVSCLDSAGRRLLASSEERARIDELLGGDPVGCSARLPAGGGFELC